VSPHPAAVAAKAYKAAHPDVDFKGQTIYLRLGDEGQWEAYGHGEGARDERSRALDMCCCHPWHGFKALEIRREQPRMVPATNDHTAARRGGLLSRAAAPCGLRLDARASPPGHRGESAAAGIPQQAPTSVGCEQVRAAMAGPLQLA
jgi:hypothetical protein